MRFRPNQLVTVQFNPIVPKRHAVVKYLRDDAFERQQWAAATPDQSHPPYYYCIQYVDDGTTDTYVSETYLDAVRPGTYQANIAKQ